MSSEFTPAYQNPYTVKLSSEAEKRNAEGKKIRDEAYAKRTKEEADAAAATAKTADVGNEASKLENERLKKQHEADEQERKDDEAIRLAAEKRKKERAEREAANAAAAAKHAEAMKKIHDELVASTTSNIVDKLKQILEVDVEIGAAYHKIATCVAERTRVWNLTYTEMDRLVQLTAADGGGDKMIEDKVKTETAETEGKIHAKFLPKINKWLADLKNKKPPTETPHDAVPIPKYSETKAVLSAEAVSSIVAAPAAGNPPAPAAEKSPATVNPAEPATGNHPAPAAAGTAAAKHAEPAKPPAAEPAAAPAAAPTAAPAAAVVTSLKNPGDYEAHVTKILNDSHKELQNSEADLKKSLGDAKKKAKVDEYRKVVALCKHANDEVKHWSKEAKKPGGTKPNDRKKHNKFVNDLGEKAKKAVEVVDHEIAILLKKYGLVSAAALPGFHVLSSVFSVAIGDANMYLV